MNQHDRNNLEFIMRADSDTLRDWMDQLTEDELDYASELLDQYGNELALRTAMLLVEPKDNEYSEAVSLINRIKESSRSS
jgi:phage protein D